MLAIEVLSNEVEGALVVSSGAFFSVSLDKVNILLFTFLSKSLRNCFTLLSNFSIRSKSLLFTVDIKVLFTSFLPRLLKSRLNNFAVDSETGCVALLVEAFNDSTDDRLALVVFSAGKLLRFALFSDPLFVTSNCFSALISSLSLTLSHFICNN